MTKLEQAARMALEALESLQGGCTDSDDGTVEAITVWCPEVIAELRAALAAPAEQPIGIMSRATYATSSGAGYKALTLYFEELHDAEQVRLWAQTCGTKARAPASVSDKPATSEPVAWLSPHGMPHDQPVPGDVPLYAAPPDAPPGWVLVPVEPTAEMVSAACSASGDSIGGRPVWKLSEDVQAAHAYRAMLAAAPKAPT